MKFFKNAMVYRLNRDLPLNAEELEEQLQHFAFTPAGSQDMAKTGWVAPIGESLVYSSNGQLLLIAQTEAKNLPSDVIKRELNAKIEKLEGEQLRKLKKTEKDSLKDEVLHSLMPRAFSKFSQTQIWIDTTNNLITVDAASAKKAEDALALLRKSIGSLPVVPLTLENPVELTITEWVKSGDMPAGFALGDSATLKAVLEDGGILKSKKQDLVSDEIATHLEAGKVVTELALQWQERITFTLTDAAAIKRIHFSDSLTEQNDDIDREDVGARFDADFVLMTGELSSLIYQLVNDLGGEAKR